MTVQTPYEILQQTDPFNLMAVETALKSVPAEAVTTAADIPVYFLSNFTVSGILPFVEFHGLKNGLKITARNGDFNVLHQALMQDKSDLHTFAPRITVLALNWDLLARGGTDLVMERVRELFDLAASKLQSAVVVNTFLAPLSGGAASVVDRDLARAVDDANAFVRGYVADHSDKFFLCDWNRYVMNEGVANTLDRRYGYMAKAPFKPAFLSQYARDVVKIARALSGQGKKVLALDCDNTLWGGVLGEDGLDGIQLHADDYPGNVFSAVQHRLIALQSQGVLLALCSKNNEIDVMEVLDTHPHCVLKREHITAHRINWDNKAENLAALADELNLGLDSFVFVDDSDFECDLVRSRLPMVDVVQVPKRLYDYPDTLARELDGLFVMAGLTGEDAKRAELYAARAEAEHAKAQFDDLDSYLQALEIEVDFHEMQSSEIPRVAQLTQKTNQFNLNKTPYSADEIAAFDQDPQTNVYVLVVKDRYGALGLTNVCILKTGEDGSRFIDTYLMSCRVFERRLEHAFLGYIFDDVGARQGEVEVTAHYRPSAKNAVAGAFLETAGFVLEDEGSDGKTYRIALSAYVPQNTDFIRKV